MKTNLAYIDDVMDRTITEEVINPTMHPGALAEVKAKAQKSIAGFHLHDEAAERKAMDENLAKRREVLEGFRTDREEIRGKLGAVGVTPLAVVPISAWVEICKRAGLFRLWTNERGRVVIDRRAFADFVDPTKMWKMSGAEQLAKFAKNDWPGLMAKFFPNGEMFIDPTKPDAHQYTNVAWATLVMPIPPDDVAAVLLKAQEFDLKVATVAEAIGFKETLEQLRCNEIAKREEEIRYREWLRNDPIVYTDHGSATAIIAQFGDFPIEKEVVDLVVKSDHLIVERPKPLETSPIMYGAGQQAMSAQEMYLRQIGQIVGQQGPFQTHLGFLGRTGF